MSTKSDLILRDFDLLQKLANVTDVDLAVSISSVNEKTAKIFEPGAASPQKRIEILKKFSGFCRSVSVLNIPVIPYISDSYEELEEMFILSKKNDVDNLVSYPLHLRNWKVKNAFFDKVKKYFPDKYENFINLYKNSSTPNKEYTTTLYEKIDSLRNQYNLYDNYTPLKEKNPPIQLELF